MRIERIELYHVEMPLISPWRTAYGEDPAIQSVLCRMVSGSVDGWGETAPLAAPCYSPEWAGGVFAVAKQWLAPALLNQDIVSGYQLQRMLAVFKGNFFAKAALDTAWWSLHSRLKNRPLHECLGATRDTVPVGADFGVTDSLDELLRDIGGAVDAGFPRIKLKFRPGWGLPMLQVVRGEFPTATFHIDCNSAYVCEDLDLFREVDELQLAMIEQPLAHDDLIDHAWLQTQIKTPICLDESIRHVHSARQAVALPSCRFINIKPGRVGGLTNALQIHAICQRAGIANWVGGMLESAVGASHCIALAMLKNFTYPGDIFPTSRFYHEDLAARPIELQTLDGVPSIQALRDLPDPDPQRLKAQTLQSAVLE